MSLKSGVPFEPSHNTQPVEILFAEPDQIIIPPLGTIKYSVFPTIVFASEESTTNFLSSPTVTENSEFSLTLADSVVL